jgi:hypothetical protein
VRAVHLLVLMVMAAIGLADEQRGLATIYYPGDRSCGHEKADGTLFTKDDSHIAHRWLPIGTKGFLCNPRTSHCVLTVVRDRGPFGSIKPCKGEKPSPYTAKGKVFHAQKITWNKRCYWWQAQPGRLQKGFRYRGEFDVTRPVANKISMTAFDKVVFYYGTGAKLWKTKNHSPALLASAI